MQFLKPSQIDHTEKLISILGDSFFACDFSVMGAGKTYVANAIGIELDLPLFVLSVRGSLGTWEKVGDDMDEKIGRKACTNVIFTSTYESFRSVTNCQPKHGWLTRKDTTAGAIFEPTKELKERAKSGMLFVIDECQKIKNNSDQTNAVKAVIDEIIQANSRSRILLLSGTPFEDTDMAVNFYRTIGFINQTKLYDIRNGEFVSLGLEELIGNLDFFQPDQTEDLIKKYHPFVRDNVRAFVFESFTEIIVPYFSSAMPSPVVDAKKDVGNGYYLFKGPTAAKNLAALEEAIAELKSASSYNPDNQTVGDKKNLGQITKALVKIEKAKVPLFVRIIKEELDKDQNNKVILFVNYRETIADVYAALKNYFPLIYDGSVTSRKKEEAIIEAFNQGDYRLLIANLRKGGISISLHDTVGNSPRKSFISPNYSILDMHQASSRTYRQNTKSDVTVRIVYGQASLESKILDALARKTENLKQILKLQAEEGILFPGEYPEYHNL